MTRTEIADVFSEIAVLLDLKGENPFKVRAYQSGARLLETMSDEEYAGHLEADDWRSVRGVGEALSDKIMSLHKTGKLEFYDTLKASLPPGLIEMLDIPGLGPKKVKALGDKLGLTTIDGLRLACQEGRVADLSGFGVKTQEKILLGIERREAYSKRHLWWSAEELASPILAGLRSLPGVTRAEIAGSLRRGMETVGDIDFIVAASQAGPVMDWFTSLPELQEVSGRGETKCSVRFLSGLQADLRLVPEEQFPFALHHFTGSKEHNILMRQRALARGWSLSEWGLSLSERLSERAPRAGAHEEAMPVQQIPAVSDERELFAALGLEYIPAELREGLGELEAAQQRRLPSLITCGDLRGAFHNHTTASDGRSSLAEMAEEAQRLGWDYLGIADHSKSSFQANGLEEERLFAQSKLIRSWNEQARTRTVLLTGTECDILADGSLDFDESIRRQLDYVVVSVHNAVTQDEETMTRRIIKAIESPCVHIMGHLTGRLLLRREAYAVNVGRVIDAALANGVVMELNANIKRLDMDWRHWRRAAERGLLCAINPDAHDTHSLSYVRAGVNAARKGWLTPASVLNTRSLAEVKAFFAGKS